jgi:hypothetical protein
LSDEINPTNSGAVFGGERESPPWFALSIFNLRVVHRHLADTPSFIGDDPVGSLLYPSAASLSRAELVGLVAAGRGRIVKSVAGQWLVHLGSALKRPGRFAPELVLSSTGSVVIAGHDRVACIGHP